MHTRPTTDRMKETLFNIIRDQMQDAKVLDLFGGSGSLGIEALSRGAKEAYFIDKDPGCVDIIRENLAHTGFEAAAKLFCTDFAVAIRKLHQKGLLFDVIFLDPPYDTGILRKVIQAMEAQNILAPQGLIVIERSHMEVVLTKKLQLLRDEKYGMSCLTFLAHRSGGFES